MRGREPAGTRWLCAARAALGAAYLTWWAGWRPPAPAGPVVAILGARHLTQAALTWRRPDRTVLALGAAADATHAATMVAAGLVPGRWRTAALADALAETALAAVGLACSKGSDPVTHRKDTT